MLCHIMSQLKQLVLSRDVVKVLFIHIASESQYKETAIEYVHNEFSLAESDENFVDSMLNIFH